MECLVISGKSSSNKGTSTNQYGFYSITLTKGKYEIVYSFIGLKTIEKSLNLENNLRINVSLEENSTLINEIEITEEGLDKNVEKTSMSQVKLKIQNIKAIPAILGEVDVLKAAQLLPGISGGGEGSAGLYVRGGGPDQNLVLLDEAVVYNVAHLFGFFSVFNADAIKDINIIKGGMPAEYGGRLSSVLDITMKDGNNKKFGIEGGIGFISSRITVEGPIKKDTSSFIISGRRTYFDVFAKPFVDTTSFAGSSYYFYDLTTIVRKDWIIKFCKKIIKKNWNITWQMPSGTRSEALDDETLGLMMLSGQKHISYAPESASKTTLQKIKKK